MKELSIIVPVYNAKLYITDTLNSLLALKNSEFEYIIVNDGSTDNSKEICESFVLRDKRFHLINKENGGVSTARNIGLINAIGKYVLFLDADDRVAPCIENVVALCKENSIPVMILRRFYITRNCMEYDWSTLLGTSLPITYKVFKITDVPSALMSKCFASGSGEVLFERNLATEVAFNERLSLFEDYDFFFHVFEKSSCNIFLYDDYVTYVNDDVPGSLTKRKCDYRLLTPGTLLQHTFLRDKPALRKKLMWYEVYFHFKKIGFFDRWRYCASFFKTLFRNMCICKYTIGAWGLLLFNIDVNAVRIKLYSILKDEYKNNHSNSQAVLDAK